MIIQLKATTSIGLPGEWLNEILRIVPVDELFHIVEAKNPKLDTIIQSLDDRLILLSDDFEEIPPEVAASLWPEDHDNIPLLTEEVQANE